MQILENFLPDLIIYHNVVLNFPCPDGLASAWVASKKFPDTECLGWTYAQNDVAEFPDLTNYQNILVVDFSFPVYFLEQQQKLGKNIIIIDHHEGFETEILKSQSYTLDNYIFNVQECGATLTWKVLFKDQPVPIFLKYIRDRDLNIKELPYSDYVHSGMGYLHRSFSMFDQIYENENYDPQINLDWLVPIGAKSMEKKYIKIKKYLEKIVFWGNIPICTLNKSDMLLKSDLGDVICKYFPFVQFCVILNKSNLSHIRIRSRELNLIKIFSGDRTLQSYGIVVKGHTGACSFQWDLGLERLQKFLTSLKLE